MVLVEYTVVYTPFLGHPKAPYRPRRSEEKLISAWPSPFSRHGLLTLGSGTSWLPSTAQPLQGSTVWFGPSRVACKRSYLQATKYAYSYGHTSNLAEVFGKLFGLLLELIVEGEETVRQTGVARQ